MTRAPLLLATWLAASCMLGCAAPPVVYPTTEAERTGIEKARRDAVRYLDCEDVEVVPVEPREVCDVAGECRLLPTSLGGELVARGCGHEMRFYCERHCATRPDRSYCLPEILVGLVNCAHF